MGDGANEELIVCALFHDVGETLGPLSDGQVGAALLRPFVSEQNYGVLASASGTRPQRLRPVEGQSLYQACVDFTTNWDEVSFTARHPSEPLSTFEPMVRSVLSRPRAPPGTS
jgi:predicted HD phosphohydrolase